MLRRQTGWIDLVGFGLGFKVTVLHLYDGNITHYELAVQLSSGNVELGVSNDFLYRQDNPIIVWLITKL